MTRKQVVPRELTRDSPFDYRCLACGRCCREYQIQVNPYEVLRLARQLGLSTTAFARTYLEDGPYLARDAEGACVFLSGARCGVHGARPLVCRLYPLVRHLSAAGRETFSLLDPVADSEGRRGDSGRVDDYLREQGAYEFMEAADRYLALHWKLVQGLETSSGTLDAGEGELVWTDLLDPDPVVEHHLAITRTRPPSGTEEFAQLHIHAVEAWLEALLKGDRP